jgi:D-alanine--poly(phosphoribitol) ligase subunit 2
VCGPIGPIATAARRVVVAYFLEPSTMMKNSDLATDTRGTDGQMDEKIRQYLAETLLIEFGDAPGATSEDENLFESGLIDSFGFVQLVAFLEKTFDIKISDDEVLSDALSTYAKIRSFVETKVAE